MSIPEHSDLTSDLQRAMLTHVAFDGWSDAAFAAAATDCGLSQGEARAQFPRGALDVAIAHHKAGDNDIRARLGDSDLRGMRYSDRVAHAVMQRIEIAGDREVVRKASALFALPQNAGDGAALLWGTADAIWDALGDSSRDGNWYSKRAILSGVYGSSVLYWLGDDSAGFTATRAFVDRRVANVMAFEKFKASMRTSGLFAPAAKVFDRMMESVKPPSADYAADLPGSLGRGRKP